MRNASYIPRILIVLAPIVALIPLGRMVADWVEVTRMLEGTSVQASARSWDWVVWQEHDGLITADYVFPDSPARRAGLQEGDTFYLLDYQQFFNVEDLQRIIEGIPPGTVHTYTVQRGDAYLEVDVRFTRYPTFLYPLSNALWRFSVWGFTLGAFFHLLGLIIAVPLAWRSLKARFSLLLIGVSALWMFGNLLRILWVEVAGPPIAGSTGDHAVQALTFVGLIGWVGFPILLLRKAIKDTYVTLGRWRVPTWGFVSLPPALLAAAALITTLQGSLGPISLDSLVVPILFYACCYIAAAAALFFAYRLTVSRGASTDGWSRGGSLTMLGVALLFGLAVLDVVPIFGAVTDTTAGWIVVGAQLLSIAPVVLVSIDTLRYGKVSHVLSRALTYGAVLGLIFFAFVGGMTLLDPYLDETGTSPHVIAGLYVVLLLVIFERLARHVRTYVQQFFATDRQRVQKRLNRLLQRMRTVFDFESLAQETVDAVGEAFDVRSVRLFLQPSPASDHWISSAYHPEPPYLTERVVRRIWPYIQRDATIWARNDELNESSLPPEVARLLTERNIVLVVPILEEDRALGLLALGEKRHRRAVYNLEDLDQLRSLSGQLALAAERLTLVERERTLIRETAEAELVALRAQINPHFLFNALNTIISLIEEQPEDAVETVEHLSAIFRYTLQTGSRPFVTLEEELTLVDHYLAIEHVRFEPRLTIERDVDPSVRSHPVPAFAIQTLVENAVKHGLEKQRGGGHLSLTCRRKDDGVQVVVSDTGVGIPSLFEQGERPVHDASFLGIGLQNVSTRLEELYGRDDLLWIRSEADRGTTVRLELPVRPPPSADSPRTLTLDPALSDEGR